MLTFADGNADQNVIDDMLKFIDGVFPVNIPEKTKKMLKLFLLDHVDCDALDSQKILNRIKSLDVMDSCVYVLYQNGFKGSLVLKII